MVYGGPITKTLLVCTNENIDIPPDPNLAVIPCDQSNISQISIDAEEIIDLNETIVSNPPSVGVFEIHNEKQIEEIRAIVRSEVVRANPRFTESLTATILIKIDNPDSILKLIKSTEENFFLDSDSSDDCGSATDMHVISQFLTINVFKGGKDFYRSLSPGNISDKLEWILIEVKIDSKKIHIFNCYKPPNIATGTAEWAALFTVLDSLPNLIIGGDLNSYHHLWGSDFSNKDGTDLATAIKNSNLYIMNTGVSTRIHTTQFQKGVRDVTLVSSDIFAMTAWRVGDDARGTDHFPIVILLQNLPFYRAKTRPRIRTNRVDWVRFGENFTDNKCIMMFCLIMNIFRTFHDSIWSNYAENTVLF